MMSDAEIPTYLIYGLIDPRTLLIRYVGLSSSGLKRPKQHACRSGPDTYCRRWVKSLQHLGLAYEITVLEAVQDASKLAEAERWWIAFGRACGWPLTNLTDGGGPSEEVVIERYRRKSEWEAREAARIRSFYSPEEVEDFNRFLRRRVPAEIERRCLQFFNESPALDEDRLIEAVIKKVCVTRETATRLLAEWSKVRSNLQDSSRSHVDVAKVCYQLFEKYIGSGQMLVNTVIEARVTPETAARLYRRWLKISQRRGKAALQKDRKAKITLLRKLST